ncbi:hypothetical protein [Streptomyces sp. LUP30]|uniref:hypothetical protein n=1 Tax=Streptomyces sp. LUP30 TaxID=1890285 RepID=UPI0008518A97|nr:hypothetical protein [Streptomyces sp. LUP30]
MHCHAGSLTPDGRRDGPVPAPPGSVPPGLLKGTAVAVGAAAVGIGATGTAAAAATVLSVALAPSGGQAVMLKPD